METRRANPDEAWKRLADTHTVFQTQFNNILDAYRRAEKCSFQGWQVILSTGYYPLLAFAQQFTLQLPQAETGRLWQKQYAPPWEVGFLGHLNKYRQYAFTPAVHMQSSFPERVQAVRLADELYTQIAGLEETENPIIGLTQRATKTDLHLYMPVQNFTDFRKKIGEFDLAYSM
jgi:hypothetical protein